MNDGGRSVVLREHVPLVDPSLAVGGDEVLLCGVDGHSVDFVLLQVIGERKDYVIAHDESVGGAVVEKHHLAVRDHEVTAVAVHQVRLVLR